MAERTIKTKLLVRTDTTANWESENPILQANEFGFDSTVQAFKKGDGTTTWKNLEYVTDIRLANKTEIANANERVYLVIGNTTGTAGTWTGTNERITSYFDGLLINYKIGVAGGSSTTTLNINGLGAKTIYLRGTTKLTTHYEVGTMVLLSYNSSKGAFYSADYDANSYAYVRQYTTTTSAEYPMLMAYETTIPSSYDTKYVRKNSTIKANPSTGTITATTFKGSLNGNADTSTKATQDGNGNVISETYATKEELENAILNGGGSEQQWTPKEGYYLLHEIEYIYISPETSKDMDVTIGEGRYATEGTYYSIYWSSSTNKKFLRMITVEGENIEFQIELSETEEENIYSVMTGGLFEAPIIMTNNDYVYFVEEGKDYYTKEQIDNKVQTINTSINNKVDKVSGKGLSTNDYTTTEKNKLAGISSGAEKNVQSDWNVTDTSSDAYIKNKPTIPNTNDFVKTTGDQNISGVKTFNGDALEIGSNTLLIANGSQGTNGQILSSTGSGVKWINAPSGGSGGGSTPRTMIYATQNPTAYNVAFFENQDEGGYNLDITLNLPNSYFKLDLSEIEQIEDIDLSRVKRLNIRSNYNDVKVFLYTSNYNNIQFDYPYFTFNCSNAFLFVENGIVNNGDIYIDGAGNYGDEWGYISLYCDHNIFQYTFYAYYDEIGNCHISYSLNGFEV